MAEFEYQPGPGMVLALQEELEGLFEPAGLKIDVREIVTRPLRGRKDRAAVVRFSNQCIPPPPTIKQPDPVSHTLAFVHHSGERILDLVEVDCAAVSRYIAAAVRRHDARRLEVLFRRALARVLAHELLHWVMNEKRHSDSRLFRAQVDAIHLVDDGVVFDDSELTRLQRLNVSTIAVGF